jgi:hypothetical protein
MPQDANIPQIDTPAFYVERIRHHVEQDEVGAARRLVAEALREGADEPGLKRWAEVLAPAKILGHRPASTTNHEADLLWLQEHGRKYRGEWVAILRGELLAHAKNYGAMRAQFGLLRPGDHPLVQFIE